MTNLYQSFHLYFQSLKKNMSFNMKYIFQKYTSLSMITLKKNAFQYVWLRKYEFIVRWLRKIGLLIIFLLINI